MGRDLNKWKGYRNRAAGKSFEDRINASFEFYRRAGTALISKTPEPFKIIDRLGGGRFIGVFETKAQPDYKGVLRGGKAVCFEAKFTTTDRLQKSVVKPQQVHYLGDFQAIGGESFVIAGFATGNVYLVPWEFWRNMEFYVKRKYVTETDLDPFRVYYKPGTTTLLILFNVINQGGKYIDRYARQNER